MIIALTIVHVLMCFAIIAIVLLQAGKGADIGSAFGGAGSQAVFGSMGTPTVLGKISSLIPTITSDNASHEVGSQIYSGLVTFDKDLKPVGDLAESWEFSKDCRDLTFRLRPGVKWHDGQPFTADDVVFTWQTIIDAKTPSPYKSEYALVESVRAEGPGVVRVHYSQPFAKALTNWATAMLPKHLLETYVREGRIREAPQNWSAPVGTGPSRFT